MARQDDGSRTSALRQFWSRTPEQLFTVLGSSTAGLTDIDASARLRSCGLNVIAEHGSASRLQLLAKQFASPLVLILVFGAFISLILRDLTDAIIILAIVLGSALLSFWQEYRASQAVAALRSQLALTCRVLRDGAEQTVPASTLVPGDVLLLAAGSLVPADGLILGATDFLVTQAALTGESLPVEKSPGVSAPDAPVSARLNAVFMGSSARSGTAQVLVINTGRNTEFGAISAQLQQAEPATEFERGVGHFGTLLLRLMFVMVGFVLAVNQLLGRPFVESMLFAVALAVGLSPELLPAIVTVTLSTGARNLSKRGVIVRRLEALENFGSMDVLCTDKTGTITSGQMSLFAALDPSGADSPQVKRLAYLNAALETGIANPMDAALVAMGETEGLSTAAVRKLDEIPYDFQRRKLTIVLEEQGRRLLITKGAFAEVLEACTTIGEAGSAAPLTDERRQALGLFFRNKGEEGFRVLALATCVVPPKPDYTRVDEQQLGFAGFLLFADPIKDTAGEALRQLAAAGVSTKIVSGDNRHVTAHVGQSVGLNPTAMLTGEQIAGMSEEALWHHAPKTDLFVEVEPQQKDRIVRALQRRGHAVGYLGDGINDAPALHSADIGISVDQAVDVARETADIVLLKPDLHVLLRGIEDGRRTFANTLKYISITVSANFGNMVSMALATPLLPFLPLLPKQILLNNFLSELPSIAISTDRVDPEHLKAPQRWDVRAVGRFMVVFGLASSLFDLLTFAALLLLFQANESVFHTGWFIVSLLTQLAVVMVLRTRRAVWRSRASTPLLVSSLVALAATLMIPFLPPGSELFGFVPVRPAELLVLIAIVAAYLVGTEGLKRWFYLRTAKGN